MFPPNHNNFANLNFIIMVYLELDRCNKTRGVSGTCTSITKKKKLEGEMGFDMYLFDANEPKLVEFLVSLKLC